MRYLPLYILILTLTLASTIDAQPAPQSSIQYGDVVTGTLSEDVPEVHYTFQANAGDIVTIRMNAIDSNPALRLDSYIQLLDSNYNEIASDDDSGGNLNAFLVSPSLTAGSYIIVASRCCGTSGEYELTLDKAEITSVALGEPITFHLDSNNPIGFAMFSASQTDADFVQAVIQRVEGAGNFYGNVHGEMGRMHYGSRYGEDFILTPVPIQTPDDVYYFGVVLDVGTWDDPYRATQEQLPVTVEMVIEPIVPQVITFDQAISDTVSSNNPIAYYSFEAGIDDSFRFALDELPESSARLFLSMFDTTGTLFTSGSTFYPSTSFVLDPLNVTRSGEQLVMVTYSADYRDDGSQLPDGITAYQFTLSSSQSPMLGVGESVTDEITPQNLERIYLFDGREGQTITITLTSHTPNTSASMDMQLPPSATGGSGNVFGVYSTIGDEFSYTVTLPVNGRYIIRVYYGYILEDGVPNQSFTLSIN
jgi:hypothetical protein